MEYIYTAMLLHTPGQEISEENVKKVLEAAGAEVDDARVKALIAALEDVDIEEAMEKTAVAAAAPVAAAAAPAAAEEEEEEEICNDFFFGRREYLMTFFLVFKIIDERCIEKTSMYRCYHRCFLTSMFDTETSMFL